MALNRLTLTDAIVAIGVAQVAVGDPFTTGGMEILGATEGDISIDAPFEDNPYTANEYTGGVAHDTTIVAGAITVTVPLLNGQADVYDKIAPNGDGSGGGWSSPISPVTTSVLIIPIKEMSVAGVLSYTSPTWVPAAPVHAIWIWKAYPLPGATVFGYDQGGKRITSVTFRGMFYGPNPEGHKVWTRGNPVDAGITTIAI
jgi:hypothetical protein